MRFNRTSFAAFRTGRTGRLMLPVGFALMIAAGTYVFAESEGYERGKADQASAQESVKNLARLVAQPIELDDEPTAKGDRLAAPSMIRAIEPASLYRPSDKARAAKANGGKPPVATASTSVPSGVERFDHCEGTCDTRDPMIVRTAYPMVIETPASYESSARPPALIENRTQAASDSFLGIPLPSLPSAGELVDRTVAGTSAAYDGLKQKVTGAIDALR